MSTRRVELLDAAIAVLGRAGVHGVTHRAVDAAAGLPAGSAANLFRTRDALLEAVVDRFVVRERALWDELATAMHPSGPQEIARTMAVFAQQATGPNRALTLARFAILVEAGLHPALRERLAEGGSRVDAWFTSWLRTAGSADPERDAPIVMNHWTGVVLHALARPDPAFDPYPEIAALVTRVIRPEEVPT